MRPHQWANDWISDDEGGIHNPASVQLDPEDVARFDASRNDPGVGTFWTERRLDRVTLRFRSIPRDHDARVERVAALMDDAASHVMDLALAGRVEDVDRSMVSLWLNRMAWHLRTGHASPALVHEVLMAGAIPGRPWWHGSDGIVSKVRLTDREEAGE